MTPGEKQIERLRKQMVRAPRLSKRQKHAINGTGCTNYGRPGANILITAGGGKDGCLDVHMLCSRPCAVIAGFPWAGR